MIMVVFLHSYLSNQHLESKSQKFIEAKPGEWWRINDKYTLVLDEPDFHYDDWRYIFRNKYSITWHDFEHTIDMIGRYKHVLVIKTMGYVERWKFVKYGKSEKGILKIKYGWILGTTVEGSEKIKSLTQRKPYQTKSPHTQKNH